jgi:catechol 2,3-dioxygenase-like lactoylglutathione lyase family enzyme
VSGLRVLETSLYVDDLDAAERFYHGVLGLEVRGRHPGRHVFFRCGGGVLLVFAPEATAGAASMVDGTPIPPHGADGPGHVAFAVPEPELASWKHRLIQRGVAIEAEVRWPRGGSSVYFRDPAGNSLELASPAIWGLPEDP